MLIQEVFDKNQQILQDALKLQSVLNTIKDKNVAIEECDNAFLFYSTIAPFSAQKKAPLGEKFLCHKLNYQRIAASKNMGDAIDQDGTIYEFKNSFTNQNQNLNIRQIRLWQPIDFYYCFYINEKDLDKSIFFELTKDQMIEEVAICGGYTHGTIEANKDNVNREYSITIPIYNDNNEKTKRWKEKYLSEDLKRRVLK